MNAVERFWRGLEERDWAAMRAQIGGHASIAWPHRGEVLDALEYLARLRERRGRADVEVLEVITEGRRVAVEARMGSARCGGFYDMHDGKIVSGTEYWVGEKA